MVISERDPSYRVPHWMTDSMAASGVDIFFVISGYVICLTASRHRQGAWDFLRNRLARVVPLHYALTVILTAAFILFGPRPGPRQVFNSFVFLPLLNTTKFTMPVNITAWTLCFEIWFYLLFTLLLLIAPARRSAWLLPAVLLVGAVLVRWYHLPWFPPRLMFDPICLEFGLGCLLFLGQEWLGPLFSWSLLSITLVLYLTVVPHFGYLCGVPFHSVETIASGEDYLHSWQRVLVWGLPSAMLVAALLGLERHAQLTLPRSLVALGDASYSLYLLQSITVIPAQWLTRLSGTTNPFVPSIILAVLTIGLSIICWRYLELPLTHLARRWLGIAPNESRAGEPTFAPGKPERGGK